MSVTPSIPTTGAARDATDLDAIEARLDTRAPIRAGLWLVLLGFGGFLAWAVWAPLDEGVVTTATVSQEARRRSVQHLSGGVVRVLKVKEGQWVKQCELLLELEEANARAGMESVRQTYLAQRAAESRLTAELASAGTVSFHEDLLTAQADPAVRQHMSTQVQLFNARRAALAAELAGLQDAIAGVRTQIQGYTNMLVSRQAQAAALDKQLLSLRSLADQGYAPRNQVLQLEQAQAEIKSSMAEVTASRGRAEQQILELSTRTTQRRQEYQKEASAALAEVRREVQSGQDKLRATTEELQRVAVRAPVDGQVVGLSTGALGAVVVPGQKLMDIVPRGQALLVDARIPPNVIDRVKVGGATDIRFSAFAHSPQLVLQGRLESVSEDVVVEPPPANVPPYYLGRVAITPEGMKALGGRNLQPGMPAEVLIRTGERSLLTYLLHPLVRRVAASMKEE